MLQEYIVFCWIGHLITALVVSAAWIVLTRRYARRFRRRVSEYNDRLIEQEQDYESMLSEQFRLLSEKEKELSEKTEALQELYYRIHHAGPRPAMASVLGLFDLSSRDSKALGETLELLSRPNHHKYAALAIKHKKSMDDMLTQALDICKKLYEASVKTNRE